MKAQSQTIGAMLFSSLVSLGMTVLFTIALLSGPVAGQASSSSDILQPTQQPDALLSPQEAADLKVKAAAGDAVAQVSLGQAYRKGDGVPKNEDLAYKWVRKSAEQGNATAENELGTMYRLGEGVVRDKEEAARWYQKAAHHGSAEGMFNLGTCHYNGDGVGANEYTAYIWFLLALDAGDKVAEDAVRRSAATMSKNDNGDAYLKIAAMYEKGEEVPKDNVKRFQWLRKAADLSPAGKVILAGQLIKDGANNYPQAMELCKAAANDLYHPAQRCVGYLYRHGLGVARDAPEALKWYRKAAGTDRMATVDLAEMYAAGEGTTVDRAEAFMMYFLAATLGAKGALSKANSLWEEMDKSERKKVENKLLERRLDPKKVIASLPTLAKQ